MEMVQFSTRKGLVLIIEFVCPKRFDPAVEFSLELLFFLSEIEKAACLAGSGGLNLTYFSSYVVLRSLFHSRFLSLKGFYPQSMKFILNSFSFNSISGFW